MVTARSVMTAATVSINADADAGELKTRLVAEDCETAVVVDGDDRFVEIARLADLLSRGDAHATVASVMQDSCSLVEAGTALEQLIPLTVAGNGPVTVMDDGR